MKIYTYDDGNKQTNMKRANAEWFNHDCPDTYDNDGNLVFTHPLFGSTYIAPELHKTIYDFVKKSHEAFCKKYKYPSEDFDNLAISEDIKNYLANH